MMKLNVLPLACAVACGLLAACDDAESQGGSACRSDADLTAILADARSRATERAAAAVDAAAALTPALAAARGGERGALQAAVAELQLAFAAYEPLASGPDGSLQTVANVNPFPLDESAVNAYLTGPEDGGDFPGGPPAFDRGLPALDYVAFATDAVGEEALADPDLDTLIAAIQGELSAAASAWSSAEDWSDDDGTAAGSSLSVLVNGLSKHFEDLRRDRLATPAGITTLGFPNPQTVQAPYAGTSLDLLAAGIAANRDFYRGSDEDSGLDAYLLGLDSPDAGALAADITAQYATSLEAIGAVDEPLEAAVADEGGDPEDVQAAYAALSLQVVNLKTDLPSVACIAITYVDNPSDSD